MKTPLLFFKHLKKWKMESKTPMQDMIECLKFMQVLSDYRTTEGEQMQQDLIESLIDDSEILLVKESTIIREHQLMKDTLEDMKKMSSLQHGSVFVEKAKRILKQITL